MGEKTLTNGRSAFSIRLQQQLLKKGKKNSPTSLAREFNLRWRGVPVTPNAVRKWLLGDSLPTMDKMEVLANMLGVSTDWLRWDQPPYDPANSTKEAWLVHGADNVWPAENMEKAVIQDYRLLNASNRKIVFSLMEILLKEQQTQA